MDANPSAMFETVQSQSRMHENQTTEVTASRDPSTESTVPASLSTTTMNQPQTALREDEITSSTSSDRSNDADTITMDLEDP